MVFLGGITFKISESIYVNSFSGYFRPFRIHKYVSSCCMMLFCVLVSCAVKWHKKREMTDLHREDVSIVNSG